MNGNIMKTNKLVYWNMRFLDTVEQWIKTEHPLFLQEWNILLKEDLVLSRRAGFSRSNQSTLDRAGQLETVFHTQTCVP